MHYILSDISLQDLIICIYTSIFHQTFQLFLRERILMIPYAIYEEITSIISLLCNYGSFFAYDVKIPAYGFSANAMYRHKQAEVIKRTVAINEHIADNIKQENIEFSNINDMVENNTKKLAQMTEQITVLNEMVEQINQMPQ